MNDKLTEILASTAAAMLSLEEVPDEDMEAYCRVGEIVSASIEDADSWLAFKQLLVRFLLEQKRTEEAAPLILELADLTPGDAEIQSLAKQYRHHRASPNPAFSAPNGCDCEFYALIRQLRDCSLEQLLSNAATWVNKWVEEDHEYYGLLLKWYRSWYQVGLFGQDQGFIDYFAGMYQYLKQNADRIVRLYEQLEDFRSKLTLKTILQHWLTFHPDLRKRGREAQFEHYFDLDIMKCGRGEVFVDCGCYTGDTAKAFVRNYGSEYKSIYSYELTPSTFQIAKANLKDIPRLYLRNAGVSDKNGQFKFWEAAEGALQTANRLNPNGNATAKVVRIDDDIQEDITFLKMDIEGAELEALRGAEQQIRRNRPKLAISLYHKLPDLLEIPELIKTYVPEYQFYLRHDGLGTAQFPFPTEYVLLATV